MSKIVEFVRNFVKEKHSKQKRWNGDAYYTHLEAVENIAIQEWYVVEKSFQNKQEIKLRIVSLSHDVSEDVDEFLNKEYELVAIYRNNDVDKELNEDDWADIVDALRRLNKNRSPEGYLEFTLRSAGNPYSKATKVGDLKHNSSDLKSGNMRDKYLLALYILKNIW